MLKQWMNNRRKKKVELLLQLLDTDELAEALALHMVHNTDLLDDVTGASAQHMADNVDLDDLARKVAGNFDPYDIAREVDLDDVAYNLDMDNLADCIDMDEFVRKTRLDMDDLAGYIDMDNLASHLDMEDIVTRIDLDGLKPDMNEVIEGLDMDAIASAFGGLVDYASLVEYIPPDAVAEALASASAALADDRLTAMVDCLSSMAEAIGLAVTTMQMSIKEE